MPTFLGQPNGCIAKERFKKTYRHPDLDQFLTSRRVTQEARCLAKCKQAGMDTPTVYFVDVPLATIYMEHIVGMTVKQQLLSHQETDYQAIDTGEFEEHETGIMILIGLFRYIGRAYWCFFGQDAWHSYCAW